MYIYSQVTPGEVTPRGRHRWRHLLSLLILPMQMKKKDAPIKPGFLASLWIMTGIEDQE
jgi:hypothetical protein